MPDTGPLRIVDLNLVTVLLSTDLIEIARPTDTTDPKASDPQGSSYAMTGANLIASVLAGLTSTQVDSVLTAGSNITLTDSGGKLTIATTGGGGSGVSSFNTRTGAVTLSKADVTSTGLGYSDVGADASGAAATAQTAAEAFTTSALTSYLTTASAASTYVPQTITVNGQALSGNVTVTTISGNAGTATALATARAINGVNFDGTAPITVTAAAGTLTGATLNATVVTSSLTAVGTITTGVWNGTAIANANLANSSITIAGHVVFLGGTQAISASDVGLGSVTNDAQTKAAVIPNTAPSAGQILAGNAGGTAYAPVTLSGSGATFTLSSAGVLTISAVAAASLPALNGITVPTGDVSINSHKITSLATGTADTDGVNVGQMNLALANLAPKADCQAATTTALAAYTYNHVGGSSGVGDTITLTVAAVLVLDAYTPALNDRILVKNETGANRPYNGPYKVTTLGVAAITQAVLTRTTDFDQSEDGIDGAHIFVQNGAVNANTEWYCSTNAAVTFGTTNISFSQFTGTTYTADETTLHLSGTTFSILSGGVGTSQLANTSVTEVKLSTSNNTTANVTTSKHGFAPIAPNDVRQFFRGDATWAVAAPSVYKAEDYGAIGDCVTYSATVSITSGTAALTVTAGTFATGDVGKTIIVPGAGVAGADLKTTIASVSSTTAIGLAANASTTLTSAAKVLTYGTLNTTPINNAIAALNTAGAGVLYLPGLYLVDAVLTTITALCTIRGDGSADYLGATLPAVISGIFYSPNNTSLFTVTSNLVVFRDLAMICVVGATPISGSAAITVNGSNVNQKVDYYSCFFKGFYINRDVQVGAQWVSDGCIDVAPVLYALKIRNTVNGDAGDWCISNGWFYSDTYSATAAIHMESSGGGKVLNCKFVAGTGSFLFTRMIDLHITASTSDLLVSNCSFENYSGDAIYIDNTSGHVFLGIVIHGCQSSLSGGTNTAGTFLKINANTAGDISKIVVASCVGIAASGATGAFVNLTNVASCVLSGIVAGSFAATITQTTCTFVTYADAGETQWTVIGAAGAPAFANSWANDNVGAVAAFRKLTGGVVEIKGSIKSGTIGNAAFTLPGGYRPAELRRFAITSLGSFGNVLVNTNGTVVPNVGDTTGAGGSCGQFQLDGIHFYAEA